MIIDSFFYQMKINYKRKSAKAGARARACQYTYFNKINYNDTYEKTRLIIKNKKRFSNHFKKFIKCIKI